MSGADAGAECVINVSEGRDHLIIEEVRAAGGSTVVDVHVDADHHRSVLTLAGRLSEVEAAARSVAAAAVERIDLRTHRGVHPRFGAVDVVPFVPFPSIGSAGPSGGPDGTAWQAVLDARGRFAEWAGTVLGVPCFLYGPERSLPEVRRDAFGPLRPDAGPPRPHPTAGAMAVGARPVLVAYNIWIAAGKDDDQPAALAAARSIAASIRGPNVRALGFAVGGVAQVSVNLLDPVTVTVADVYDAVAADASARGCMVLRGELVGLAPGLMLDAVPPDRWGELDLAGDRTVEARVASSGR